MSKEEILVQIAIAVRLREGSEGVRTFLRQVYQNQGISTKACAQNIRLPLPITAALKKEAIKAGLMQEGATMRLTETGRQFCEVELGLHQQSALLCPRCKGLRYIIPAEMAEVLDRLRLYLSLRPKVDVTIDQAHGTPETALRRVILALEKGALFARNIVILGDDDLVSIAILTMWRLLYPEQIQPQITVFDIDERLLDYIEGIAAELEAEINTVQYDMRQIWPQEYLHSFDVAFTDPPYTKTGAQLFAVRAKQALKAEVGLPFFFSFGQKPPGEMAAVQQELLQVGFVPEEIIPAFNEYEGAAILGNLGQMLVLRTAAVDSPDINEYQEAIYTKEVDKQVEQSTVHSAQ